MSNLNIQMKKNNNGTWDNLYPFTKSNLILDTTRNKTINTILSEIENAHTTLKNNTESSIKKIKDVSVYLDDFPKQTGDTSDSERFQRALNSFENGSLLLPMDTLNFDKTVYLDHSKTTIQGMSRGTVIELSGNGTKAFESLSTSRTRHLNSSITNFVIKDLTIRGTKTNDIGFNFTGFARGTLFENIYFEELAFPVKMSGSWSFAFRNCFINNSLQGFDFGDVTTGTHNDSYAVNDVLIDNLSATNIKNPTNTGVAIFLKMGANANITNSTLELNNTAVKTLKYDNVKIDGCYLEYSNAKLTNGNDGIQIGSTEFVSVGVKIINSFLYNFSIKITNAKGFVYDGNTIMGTLGRIIIMDKNAICSQSTIRTSEEFGLMTSLQSADNGFYPILSNIYVSETHYIAKDLSLLGAWVVYESTARGGIKIMMDTSGYVHIFGAISGGATGIANPVATIPLGFRPGWLSFFTATDAANAFVALSIASTGQFVVRTTTTDAIFINISYKPQYA